MLYQIIIRRENAKTTSREINILVMDFLVKGGYPEAAARFAEEANIEPKFDDSYMSERVRIKKAIYHGNLQTAIEEINDVNPQVRLLPLLFP